MNEAARSSLSTHSVISLVLSLVVTAPVGGDGSIDRGEFLRRLKPVPVIGRVRGRSKRLALINVGHDSRLEIEAGIFFLWMRADAKRVGIELRISSAFRTFEQQSWLHQCFVDCSCNGCRRAAQPGYSAHEVGNAIDLDVSEPGVTEWLEENAAKFGFAANVDEEPWHFEFVGVVNAR